MLPIGPDASDAGALARTLADTSRSDEERGEAAAALGKLGAAASGHVPALGALLLNSDVGFRARMAAAEAARISAIDLLATTGEAAEKHLDTLATILGGGEAVPEGVRAHAAKALGTLGASAPLALAARNDPSGEVRRAAREALGKIQVAAHRGDVAGARVPVEAAVARLPAPAPPQHARVGRLLRVAEGDVRTALAGGRRLRAERVVDLEVEGCELALDQQPHVGPMVRRAVVVVRLRELHYCRNLVVGDPEGLDDP